MAFSCSVIQDDNLPIDFLWMRISANKILQTLGWVWCFDGKGFQLGGSYYFWLLTNEAVPVICE